MSEDVLDDVLSFSADYKNALSSSPNVLKHIIGCDICNSLMLEPYTLQCGHSFCGKCLESWTNERVAQSTCPSCRADIKTTPVLSLGLRQLAIAVVHSWNADPNRSEKVKEDLLMPKEPPKFFPEGALENPRYDSEDDVYRCPHCSHEIEEDGRCSGCSAYFAAHDMYDEDAVNRWGTDTDYEEPEHEVIDDDDDDDDDVEDDEAAANAVRGSVTFQELLNFMRTPNIGEIGPRDSINSDIGHNSRRPLGRLTNFDDTHGPTSNLRSAHTGLNSVPPRSRLRRTYDDVNDDDEDDEEDDEDAEDELGSFIDDDDENDEDDDDDDGQRIGDSDENEDSEEPDEGKDEHDEEAMDTSDDSLLEEARSKSGGGGGDSDVEVTGVRHRPVVIDDDDDDD